MSKQYTAKMRPDVGMSRVNLAGLVPDEIMYGPGGSLIVEVEVVRAVTSEFMHVMLQLQEGSHPEGNVDIISGSTTVFRMSRRIEARRGWDLVACFYYGAWYSTPAVQTAESDNYVIVRVSSRPA